MIESILSDVEPIGSIISSWLWSGETSDARAASRKFKQAFERNAPVTTDPRRLVFFEAIMMPLSQLFPMPLEVMTRNSLSPLRCFAIQEMHTEFRWLCVRISERNQACTVLSGIHDCAIHSFIKKVDQNLLQDNIFAKAALRRDGMLLELLPETLRQDKDVVLIAVRQNGRALEFAGAECRCDYEIVKCAIQETGWSLKFADTSCRGNEELLYNALSFGTDGHAFVYATSALRACKNLALMAVKKSGWTLKYCSSELRADCKIALSAVANDIAAIEYIDQYLLNNRDFFIQLVSQNGFALAHASDEFKKDIDIVRAAVKNKGTALLFADSSLRSNLDLVLDAVESDGAAFEHAHDSIRTDKQAVIAAVRRNGAAFFFASESCTSDPDVVLFADDKTLITNDIFSTIHTPAVSTTTKFFSQAISSR